MTVAAASQLSIVVPCIDEHELLETFLRSVADRLPGSEAVVVDMGGWDVPADLRDRLDLRVVPSGRKSIAGAKNLGLANASRDYVALMDSDNVLLGDGREWREQLAGAFAEGVELITLGRREESRRLGDRVVPNKWNFSRHTIGWSVIWRRAHILAIGGLDERFGPGSLAGAGEDFPPLYDHFADSRARTCALPQLGVGHPSLQKPVDEDRMYRYTYGSAISTLLPLRHRPSAMAAFWAAKTVVGTAADVVRGVRRRDAAWTVLVVRARTRALADALVLGRPRGLGEA